MKSNISSRARQRPGDVRSAKGSRRRLSTAQRRRRLAFDPLESRQLLSGTPPVAEFPLRTSGGIPEGGVEDPQRKPVALALDPDHRRGLQQRRHHRRVSESHLQPAWAAPRLGAELGLITYDAKDNGNIWFYESNSNQFGQLNPTTGAITEYPALFFSGQSSRSCRSRPDRTETSGSRSPT